MIFGIVVILLSYAVSFFLPKETQKSYLVAFCFHAAIILFYAYSGTNMIGASEDASSFYNHAIERSANINNLDWSISKLSNGHDFFKNIHAVLQHFFSGPNKLLSYSTTLLAWSLGLLFLSKIYLSICRNDFKGLDIVICIYSFSPSILIFHSYLLREAWLSLFIFFMVYLAVRFKKNVNFFFKLFPIFLVALISIFFHRYMILISSVVIGVVLIYDAITKYQWYPFNNLRLIIYFGFLIVAFLIVININLEAIIFIKTNGIFGAIDLYSIGLEGGHGDGAPPARATYGKVFDKDSILSIFKVFYTYQVMPYPWMVTSIVDLAPLFENFLRILLVIIFFVNRKKMSISQKYFLDMIFLIWLAIEFVWSLGTINWGSAFRHHSVAYGLLVVSSIASYRNSKFI